MSNLKAAYDIVFYVHVVAASAGLASLTIPLIAKKGGKTHRRVGWIFTIAMTIVAFTGMAISLAWITAPLAVKPPPADWDPARAAKLARELNSFGVFLMFVGVLLLNSLQQGIASLARKRSPEPTKRLRDLVLPILVIAGGAALFIGGIAVGRMLFVSFGVIGLVAGTSDLRFVLRPLPTRMAWWYQHMSGMLTAVIAGLSAFMVFNSNRIFGGPVPEPWGIVPWILPTVVGVPAIVVWVRHYRHKFV